MKSSFLFLVCFILLDFSQTFLDKLLFTVVEFIEFFIKYSLYERDMTLNGTVTHKHELIKWIKNVTDKK